MKATTKTTATKRTTNKVNSKSNKVNNKVTSKSRTKTTSNSTYNRVEKGISSWTNKKGKTTYYARTTGKYLGTFTSLTKARAARKAVMSK